MCVVCTELLTYSKPVRSRQPGTHGESPRYQTSAVEEITSVHSREMPVWWYGAALLAMQQHKNRAQGMQ